MLLTAAAPVAAATATFAPTTYISVYKIYLRGILIARADVELALTDQHYQLSAWLRSAGLGAVFSDNSGLIKTSGNLQGASLVPQSLHYSWTGDNRINFARLNYVDGAPIEYETNYKSQRLQKVVVQVRMKDVGRGTRDPFLSLLVRQGPEKGDAFCRTPMRLFDGRRLAKLNPEIMEAPLPPTTSHTAKLTAVKSVQISCRVRWEPVAGYPEKTYERAADMHPINLEFSSIANSGFMAPREASVVTRYGTVRILAIEPFRKSNMLVVPAKLELPPSEDDDEEED